MTLLDTNVLINGFNPGSPLHPWKRLRGRAPADQLIAKEISLLPEVIAGESMLF